MVKNLIIKNLTSSAAASEVFQFSDNKTKELLRSKLNNFHHNYILFCFLFMIYAKIILNLLFTYLESREASVSTS